MERTPKAEATTATIDIDLSWIFSSTPVVEQAFCELPTFQQGRDVLHRQRQTAIKDPTPFEIEHTVRLQALSFLRTMELFMAPVIAATGQMPLLRSDCEGSPPGKSPLRPVPSVTDVNELYNTLRDFMCAIAAQNAREEGRATPNGFSAYVREMLSAFRSIKLPNVLRSPDTSSCDNHVREAVGSSAQHPNLGHGGSNDDQDGEENTVISRDLKFDLDRLLIALRLTHNALIMKPISDDESEPSNTIPPGMTLDEAQNISKRNEQNCAQGQSNNPSPSLRQMNTTVERHKQEQSRAPESRAPESDAPSPNAHVTPGGTSRETAFQWGNVITREAVVDGVLKRVTESTVQMKPVEGDVKIRDRIFSELGLRTRITYRIVKESNIIREREQDSRKFAGGLLGPYTCSHCEDLDLFKRVHISYLYDPSLVVDEIEDDALVFCLSYRHKGFDSRAFDKDRMTDLEYQNWMAICKELTSDGTTVYFWQDQKAKGVATDDDLDWIATGVLPYIVTPVIVLRSEWGGQSDDQRLWMSVERHLGNANCGLYLVENGTWSKEDKVKLIDITASEQELAARIIHGFFEGKETYHEEDRLKMIRWAVSKTIPLSKQSSRTFQNIEQEASVDCHELRYLYVQVLQNTAEVDGTQLYIKTRNSPRHAVWEDLMPVFESCTGNVAGGISVRGENAADVWRTVYHIMGNEESFYYMRFEIGNHRSCIMTGEVEGQPGGRFEHGRVLRGKKVFSGELLECFKRFAMRLALYEHKASSPEAMFFYLFQKHELISTITRAVLHACWGVTGSHVEHICSSKVKWGHYH